LTASRLDVHGANDRVLGVAAPNQPVSWGPAGQQRGASGFWVRDDEPLAVPNSSWLHEYVHTRQQFDLVPETTWLTEATAVFFATYHAHEQGLISDAEFQQSVNPSVCAGDVLSRPESGWSSVHTPYRKGSRVAAWLDRRIRELTDGAQDLHAFVRELNLREGPFDHTTLVEVLETSTGFSTTAPSFEPLREEFDRFTSTQSVPDTVGPPGQDPLPESELGTPEFVTSGWSLESVLDEFERATEDVNLDDTLASRVDETTIGSDDEWPDSHRVNIRARDNGSEVALSVGTLRIERLEDGVRVTSGSMLSSTDDDSLDVDRSISDP
jgi:hypothetical protein